MTEALEIGGLLYSREQLASYNLEQLQDMYIDLTEVVDGLDKYSHDLEQDNNSLTEKLQRFEEKYSDAQDHVVILTFELEDVSSDFERLEKDYVSLEKECKRKEKDVLWLIALLAEWDVSLPKDIADRYIKIQEGAQLVSLPLHLNGTHYQT